MAASNRGVRGVKRLITCVTPKQTKEKRLHKGRDVAHAMSKRCLPSRKSKVWSLTWTACREGHGPMEKPQGNVGTALVTDSKWHFCLCCQTKCSMERACGSAVQGASLLLILLLPSGPSVTPERTGSQKKCPFCTPQALRNSSLHQSQPYPTACRLGN